MSIQELIANAGERLTQTDRRIAAAVLDDPTLLAFGTVSDLAERMGTSRPTIVRFANKLGFGGYTDNDGFGGRCIYNTSRGCAGRGPEQKPRR